MGGQQDNSDMEDKINAENEQLKQEEKDKAKQVQTQRIAMLRRSRMGGSGLLSDDQQQTLG